MGGGGEGGGGAGDDKKLFQPYASNHCCFYRSGSRSRYWVCLQSVLLRSSGSERRCPSSCAGTRSRMDRPAPPCPCTRSYRCRPPICHLYIRTPCSHRHTCPGDHFPPSGAGPPGHASVLAHLGMTAHSPWSGAASSRPPAALLGPRGGHGSLAVLQGPEDLGTSSGVQSVRVARALGLTRPPDPDALPRSPTALRDPSCSALRVHTPHPALPSSPRRTRRTARRACPHNEDVRGGRLGSSE